MWGFKCGDRITTSNGKEGYVIKNFVGSTYFLIEEIRNDERIGLFLIVNRNEMTKREVA